MSRLDAAVEMARASIPPGGKGTLHVLGHFDIPYVDGRRRVRIYIPAGYNAARPHNVLLMFDGQNVFDDVGSFAGGWHLHAAVDRLATRTRQAPVVVGIDHGGDKRIAELMPDLARLGGDSTIDRFLDWMGNELRRKVGERVHVGPGPVHVAVGGSSMGGLAALYAHFRRPDAFGGAIAMSPSLWVQRGAVIDWLSHQSTPWVSRIYMDCGEKEARGWMKRAAEQYVAHLRGRGYDDKSLRWRLDPRGTHSETHWRRRAPGALRFMYAG